MTTIDWRKRPWSRPEALFFAKELEARCLPHYHVAFAGSVLHRGHSDKDLDLIILPHTTRYARIDDVRNIMTAFGFRLFLNWEQVREKWEKKGSGDQKIVEVYIQRRRRVDIFLPWFNPKETNDKESDHT